MNPCDILVLSAAPDLETPAVTRRNERDDRRALYLRELPLRFDIESMEQWMDLNA